MAYAMCPECGKMHYRTDPCPAKKSAPISEIVSPPVEVYAAKRGRGRPRTITDMRAYKAQKERERRAKLKGKSDAIS